MSVFIRLEVEPWTEITKAMREASRLANMLGVDVRFDFGEVTVDVRCHVSMFDAMAVYEYALGRAAADPSATLLSTHPDVAITRRKAP